MSLPEFTLLPDGLPAIPRRHRSVGPEPLTLPLELLRRQELPQAVGQRVAFANAIVPDRPHVEPPQLEDQEHLGGPPSDTTDDRPAGDELLVGEPAEAMERDGSIHALRREIPDRGELPAREPRGAKLPGRDG